MPTAVESASPLSGVQQKTIINTGCREVRITLMQTLERFALKTKFNLVENYDKLKTQYYISFDHLYL
jgi:hypothetical protein